MGPPPKIKDYQNLAADLSADLLRTAQWGSNWLVIFNAYKTKVVMFHQPKADNL